MGKGVGVPPGNVVNCFFALQILSKVSLDEVFMYYLDKMF